MNDFMNYLSKSIENTLEKEQELISADKKDEANLQKIRANIYDICHTVFQTVIKVKNSDAAVTKDDVEEELVQEYVNRLHSISKNWIQSYEKAKLHNDIEKILIEETKLEAMKEVKQKLCELYGKQVEEC